MADVKIQEVGAQDPQKRNSPILEGPSVEEAPMCYYNGEPYSSGSWLCAEGRRLVCVNGSWWYQGTC